MDIKKAQPVGKRREGLGLKRRGSSAQWDKEDVMN